MRPEDVEERLGNRQEDDPKWGASLVESMNFEEPESAAWRKHHLRRYSANKERVLTHATKSTMYKWALVVLIGIFVACIGLFVTFLVNELVNSKFSYMKDQMAGGDHAWAYFSLLLISLAYALSAGLVCWAEPCAAGSGIPEVKAYLNGVNLHKHVRVRTLLAKVVGMCFSTSSGLPIGKEGPMIHAGSVVGAALSQGKTRLVGVDTSWTKYQDLRNDRSKRDFVTFGAASGVAAAFSAPIGGILFTLEEGASFWNPTITFRGFFAAMMTELTINLVTGIVNGARQSGGLGVETTTSMFDFGSFDNFEGYHIYELFIFMLMGVCGGCIGAWFNHYTLDLANRRNVWLQGKASPEAWRVLELLLITFVWTTITFVLPLIFRVACTEKPLETDDWTDQANTLLDELVQFQCPEGHFNQLASLTLVNSDVTLQQFFHFQYSDGSKHGTFDWWVLLLFFLFYFGMAVVAAGSFCPAGLFVPTLVSGAALGRLLGHFLNFIGHGYVTDSGTYSLLGAAAVLGGMSRMTICGVVIMLEASGKNEFLLPLMLVFAAARYTGNVWNQGMYDMQIALKGLPFLEAHLKNIGLLNLHPVKEVMTSEVRTLRELNRVSDVENLLANTTHNAFPVLSRQGHVKGLILRKHLAILMKLKVFSYPSEHTTGWTSTGRDSTYSNYTADYEEDDAEAVMYADRTGDDSEGTWRHSFGSSNGPSPRASSGGNTKFSEGGLTLAAGTGATTGEALTTSEDFADRAHSGDKNADKSEQQPQDSSSSRRIASVSTAADARAALLQRKQTVSLSAANVLHFETIEKGSYPKYPHVKDIKLNPREKAAWLDLRQYMDSAPYVLNEKSSIQKAYRYFRTLGLRHLLCVDYQNRLTGILTRADLQESRLEQFWLVETDHVGNFQRIDGDAKPMEDFYVDEILSGNNLVHTVNSPLTMGATLSSDMSASVPTSVSAGDSSGQTPGEGGGDIEAGTSPGGQLQASALASIASATDYASFPLHKNK
jgi:chloride channel 7